MAPALKVILNETELVTVSADALNILSVHVHGDRISEEFASLDVSGGLYGEKESKEHLIWESDHALYSGDIIEVLFLECAATSRRGQTIDELYPEEKEPHGPWPSPELIFSDLSKRPIIRQKFTFEISPPEAQVIYSETLQTDHSFGFAVLWNWTRPDRARVSLSSNTLDGIFKREGSTSHAAFYLYYGQKVRFRING